MNDKILIKLVQCVDYDTVMSMKIVYINGTTINNKNSKSMLKWELLSKLLGRMINKTEI